MNDPSTRGKRLVSRGVRRVESWLLDAKHARYGLAVTRMLLGAMVVGFVLSNVATAGYTFGSGAAWAGEQQHPTSDFATMPLFSLVNQAARTDAGLAVVCGALILCGILFAVGYRTRLVMVPLFILWVGFLSISPSVQDQSDNLTRIAFMALFFTALGDRWSLDARRRRRLAGRADRNPLVRWWRGQRVLPFWFTALLHNLALVVLMVQLCFVYASGGLFKAAGAPWQNGTAIYAPLQTERFGTWPILSDLVTAWGPGVALLTIGTVLVQTAFPLMLLNRVTRIVALVVMLGFHLGIAVLMGLPWFSLSMVALDAVFVRDRTWRRMRALVVRAISTRPALQVFIQAIQRVIPSGMTKPLR